MNLVYLFRRSESDTVYTYFVEPMQFSGSVEVEDGQERLGLSVEEVLHTPLLLVETVVIAQLHDGVMRDAPAQLAEPRPRHPCEGRPRHEMALPTDVDDGQIGGNVLVRVRLLNAFDG